MIKYYLYLDNIRLIKRPVMRAAAENRRRKRVHGTYLCHPSFTEMHKYVSPVLYGLRHMVKHGDVEARDFIEV